MNRTKQFSVIIVFFLLIISSCSRNFNNRVENLVFLEEAEASSGEISAQRLAEIKASVRGFEDELDRKIEAGKETGNFYRQLGTEFMHQEMFGLALDSFQEALQIYPSSFTLYYHAGVCAARMSLAQVNQAEREDYLLQAEIYYRRAIQLNGRYSEVKYALAVLYFYEMERAWDAEPLLLELLENNPKDIDSLFLMGAVQASIGNRGEAVSYYEAIAEVSNDQDVIDQAMKNRNAIMGGME
ncbi:MAG: hypothetical protein JEY99_12605 [Spirochaetales bacterium]|nr:hypothetical protein [Spirochaetales bacterium]